MTDSFLDKLRRPDWLYAIAALGLTVLACVAVVGYWYIVSPTKYLAAVGPRDGIEAKLVGAFGQALQEERRDVRVRVQPFDDVRQSGQALEARKVDLAVVRPDVFLPANGLTIAILRDEALIVLAPAAAGIDDFGDLAKKRLGVVTQHEADLPSVESVLSHYDLMVPSLMVVPVEADDVEAAFKAKRIDALAFFAAPVGERAGRLARAVARASNDKINVVPVAEADAFALKNPALTPATIPTGALIGRPQVPKEDVKTIAVSYRLMARSGLDRGPISKVTEYLFQMRSAIARTSAAINLMKAPENDAATSAALPNHRGALDYFNREQLSFMDRYGDWLWLALFAGGGVSSALAWLGQVFKRRRRELVDEVLERLVEIMRLAHAAQTIAELQALTCEIDDLVATSLGYARQRTTSNRAMGALRLAIDSGRGAIRERRRDILAEQAAARREPRRITAAS